MSVHDDWVKKNLGYAVRVRRVEKALDESIQQVEQSERSKEASADTRAALVRRLTALRGQAAELAALAPIDAYQGFSALLAAVAKQLNQRDWRAAHIGITAAEKRGTQLLPACRQWADLRKHLDQSTARLDDQLALLSSGELRALNQQLADTRAAVLAGVAPELLAQGAQQLQAFDAALDAQLEEALKRHSRIELLQIDRNKLAQQINALRKRAKLAELTAIAGAAKTRREALEALATSRDEDALSQALLAARQELDTQWLPPLMEREKELARERGLERLAEVGRRRSELLAQEAETLGVAPDDLRVSFDDTEQQLAKLLLANQPDQADEAEALLRTLEQDVADLRRETQERLALQARLRRRLADYAAITATEKTQNPPGWKALEKEYGFLPEDFRDNAPDSEAWQRSAEWPTCELNSFFARFASFSAKAAKADRQQAHADQSVRQEALRKSYEARKRHATAAHRATIEQALATFAQLLGASDADPPELNPASQDQVDSQADAIEEQLNAIDAHIQTQRKTAQDNDTRDGGHSVARHGPEIPLEKISQRVTTGYTPDKVWSPFRKSSQFLNYDLMIETRDAAFADAEANEGADFGPNRDKPPANAGSPPFIITLAHGKQVGRGFEGTGTPMNVPGKTGEIYPSVQPTVLNGTYTKIKWEQDKQRWVAIQHFPN